MMLASLGVAVMESLPVVAAVVIIVALCTQ